MPLFNFLGRWTSKPSNNSTSDPVTLEPIPSPHAYRSPHSRPFQPRPQGEVEARRWLANPTPVASYMILHARDRAARHVGTTQRTHAAAETRTWVRAPTDGNLQRILQRRDDVGGTGSARDTPVLSAPSFPSLREMVVEAGVELGSDGSPVEGRIEIPQPLTAQVEDVADVEDAAPEPRGRTGSQAGSRGRSTRAGRDSPWYVHLHANITDQEQEQSRGRPRSCRRRPDRGQDQRRGHPCSRRGRPGPNDRSGLSDLPPRPSRVPGSYGEPDTSRFGSEDDPAGAGQPADVEIGTAVPGRVTRSQRMFSVSRPGPVPEEYRTWALASRAAFGDVRFGDGERSGNAKSSSDSENEGDDEEELSDWSKDVPQRSSKREVYSPWGSDSGSDSGADWDSSSSSDTDIWLDEPTQQEIHLQQIRRALGFSPRTPRRRIESWLYRNPSTLYHILTATVPHPGLAAQGEHLSHAPKRAAAMEDLEWHIRRVDWALIKLEYVDRKRRIVRKGPRVEKKVLGEARWLRRDEDKVMEPLGRSRLRFCETAE